MAALAPFKALRPSPAAAARVAAVPYDVVSADEAGALACMRHAQRKVVTVAIDSMTFRQPIRIGDLIILNAEVTYTGRTSMEAEVQVLAENLPVKELLEQRYLVYVAGRWQIQQCRLASRDRNENAKRNRQRDRNGGKAK
jgi:acyl-CoA hydrolase